MDRSRPILTSAGYQLHPTGPSSRTYLQLMNEQYDASEFTQLMTAGDELEALVNQVAWRDDLQAWPPASIKNFGRVSFYRMFPSATQRGFQGKDLVLTEAEKKREREAWVQAHLLVQEHIERREHPTFARICRLNKIFGTTLRTKELHERFSCFNLIDLPEACRYFDCWYEAHAGKIWSIQLATFATTYLIEVHPFQNANGRTARLVLDWILGLNGLPPACFEDRFHALMARSPMKWDVPHPMALARVIQAMHNTLKILQGCEIPSVTEAQANPS